MNKTMITEDYVSFETAKLLKEKGFNESIFEFYIGNKDTIRYARNKDGFRLSELDGDFYPHITHQMAMKWLREVHNIQIIVHPYTDKEGQHWSFIFDKYAYGCWQELAEYITDSWGSYEEAVEVALKYSLENLI